MSVLDYQADDLAFIINDFQNHNEPTQRYCSFDYCYNYFLSTSSEGLIKDIEKSCLVLGFYLASWGMLRASSFLLGKSCKHYQPLIVYISTLERNIWDIDVDNFSEENIETIINIYHEIKGLVINDKNADLTLVTKIMLGVFGFIPAYDRFFQNTFREISKGECGFRAVNKKSLICIQYFYEANKHEIDRLASNIFTTDFLTGEKTKINYPKSKIIDMYGFTKDLALSNNKQDVALR